MTDWTRRTLLGTAGLIGASAAAPLLLPKAARAATPFVQGGSVKFGVSGGSTSDTFDPSGNPDTHLALAWWAVRNSLTEVTEAGDLIGEAAESWTSSLDAAVWTFKIRKGVEFHNSKTLTADDVVASLNYHRGANSTSAAKILVDPVTDIKATDPLTVVITLSSGNASFPYLLSDYHLLMLPSSGSVVDWKSGVGTGGYMLESFDPGVSIKLKRFPNYWKGTARAHFDSVELINIPDATARQTALVTGQVDAISRVDIKTVSRLERLSKIHVRETAGPQYSTILMDTRSGPFKNNDVRLAFKYAIDRKQILSTVLQGHGTIGNDQPIGPTYRYFDAALAQRTYDPEKAKFHLNKAGESGLKVQLQTADVAWTEGAVDAATLYSAQAKAAGIQIDVVRKPNDGYWSNTWMNSPFNMGYVAGRPTEDWIFTSFYGPGAANNDTFWSNDRFTALLKAGRTELDDGKRRMIYGEMQQILNEDGGLIAPLFANHIVATTGKIANPGKMSGNWEMDNWRAVERWSVTA